MRSLVYVMALALLIAVPATAQENILLIIVDDIGLDLGLYGDEDPAPTPTIDSIAADGVLFRNVYGYPVCKASRAALLTGRYGFRNGIGENYGDLRDTNITIPEMLGAAYHSAAFGKWHLSTSGTVHVGSMGFEYYAGMNPAYPAPQPGTGGYLVWDKKILDGETQTTIYDHDVYMTTDVVNEAIGRIDAFGTDPWFLWVAFQAVHTPIHIPPGCDDPVDPDLCLLADPTIYDFPVDARKAMIEALDTEIGRLLQNVPANTTVIFVGDNGGQKGTLNEAGLLVPMIIKRPGLSFPGSESEALVSLVDVFDTVAEIAGVTADAEDSESLLPYLADPSQPTIARNSTGGPYIYADAFIGQSASAPDSFNPRRAIRDERFKYHWYRCDGGCGGEIFEQLYDLSANPFEDFGDPSNPDNLLNGELTPEADAALQALRQAMDNSLHDADADGVLYSFDNCAEVANAGALSCDTDGDGIGNMCDCDFNQSGGNCGTADFNELRAAFGLPPGHPNYNPHADMDCDGVVGYGDFGRFTSFFLLPPGPSGLFCADPLINVPGGDDPCPFFE